MSAVRDKCVEGDGGNIHNMGPFPHGSYHLHRCVAVGVGMGGENGGSNGGTQGWVGVNAQGWAQSAMMLMRHA